MDVAGIFTGMTISGSGLAAERARLDVIAKNIANANVVATPGGEPYRRKEVVFETVLGDTAADGAVSGSVRIADVIADETTPFETVYDPKHPLADPETGLVTRSNVKMPFEMVDLMGASRSYEANLKAMGVFRDMVRQSLRLLE